MLMPYLNFTGSCEEAFLFYQCVFGGQAPVLARYSDAPKSAYPDLDETWRDKIMHGHVMLTETDGLSGADAIWPVEKGSAVNLHMNCASVDEAQKAFDMLAEEGTVVSALQANPPPHNDGVSGMVADKYGFTWVLSAQLR